MLCDRFLRSRRTYLCSLLQLLQELSCCAAGLVKQALMGCREVCRLDSGCRCPEALHDALLILGVLQSMAHRVQHMTGVWQCQDLYTQR